LEAEKLKHEMALEQYKVQAQAELEREKMILQAQVDMQKAEYDRETKTIEKAMSDDGVNQRLMAIETILNQFQVIGAQQ